MKVPERIAIIGGSVLLSSTLVFGLKSSASSILPKISHPVYELTASDKQKQQDAHNQWWNGLSSYDQSYETAKGNNQRAGNWGSSKYYIDNNQNLHVGDGTVSGTMADLLGNGSNDIHSVEFTKNAQHSSDSTMDSNAVKQRQDQEAHDKWWNSLSDFDKGNETALQNHWQTGMWGSSKYYIDNNQNFHVGDGTVSGTMADLLGNESNNIKNVEFTSNAQHSSDSTMNSNAVQQRKQQQQAAANSSSSSNSGSSYVPPSSYVSGGGSSSNSSGASSSSSSSSSSSNNSGGLTFPSRPGNNAGGSGITNLNFPDPPK